MTTPLNTNTPSPTGYVFLDVDGVINPFDRDLKLDGWKLHEVEGYMVWAGDSVKARFQRLVEAGVQFVWATTWINAQDGLRRLEQLWGLPANLPQIDRLEWTSNVDKRNCGKRPGIIRFLNDNKVDPHATPVVWVDDDHGPIDTFWADARFVQVVTPPSERGLSDLTQVDLIDAALKFPVAVTA